MVIGAGISGLTAAKLLQESGHNVQILEASSRPGGRIQTYRDFANGWQAELGPMRIPQQHQFALAAVKMFNLTLAKFNNDPFRYHMHGKNLHPEHKRQDLQFFMDQFNIHPQDEKHTAADIMIEALHEPNQDFKILSWNEMLAKYDKYSLRSWLANAKNLSADTIDYISVFYNIEAFLDSALVEILIDECVFAQPNFQYIQHGMDLLPRSLAKNLNIKYNSKVTHIDQTGYKIRVKIDCKGVDCTNDDDIIQADSVILAIPGNVFIASSTGCEPLQ